MVGEEAQRIQNGARMLGEQNLSHSALTSSKALSHQKKKNEVKAVI